MARRILDSRIINKDQYLNVIKGGTEAGSPLEATDNFQIVSKDRFNRANGVAAYSGNSIPAIILPDGISAGETYAKLIPKDSSLNSPLTQLGPNTSVEYIISNYDLEKSYTISATQGNIVRNRDTVILTMPNMGPGIFVIDGREITINAIVGGIVQPSITNIANSTLLDPKASFSATTSSFTVSPGLSDVWYGTQYQIARDVNFSDIVVTTDVTGVLSTTITIPANILAYDTPYFIRVRQKGYSYGWSNWSTAYNIRTKTEQITIPIVNFSETVTDTHQIYVPGVKGGATTYYGPFAGEALIGHPRWQDYAIKNGVDVGLLPAGAWSYHRYVIDNTGNTKTQRVNISARFFCGIWDTCNGYIYYETVDNSVSGAVYVAGVNSGHVPDWNIYDFILNTTIDVPAGQKRVLRIYCDVSYNGDYKYNRYAGGFKAISLTHNSWL